MSFAPKHILVPVAIDPEDDFKLAQHAVFAACDIAEKFSARITLLHLAAMIAPGSASVDPSGKVYEALLNVVQERHNRGKLKLKELQKEAQLRGIAVEGRVVDSSESTASVILSTAEELKVDLLVIGSHGRRWLSKVFFGSIAEKVLERATVPVLLIHAEPNKVLP